MPSPTHALDDRFTKTTLKNGLDVIVRHDPRLPMVAMNLWYHVGSKNEERHQRGFTHLFEHLMFEGSLHYPGDFFRHLQRLGAAVNGSTSSDRTNYHVDLPVAHAELAFAMESDRMACLLGGLSEQKLRAQKDVVKNEHRQNYSNRPYGMAWSVLAEALYPPQHPYSWLTIGDMEDIERATMNDVSAFFQRFYVPGNASLAVVGALAEDRALALAERYFGPIAGGTPALLPWAPPVALDETRAIVARDRVELDRLYLVWPTVPHFQGDDAPLAVVADVLARGRTSRLYRTLVVEEQIAQDVTAFQSGRELAGSFGVVATLRPSCAVERARELIDAELEALANADVAEAELQRARNLRAAASYYALEHIGGFGGVADRLNAYNVFRGDPGLIVRDIARFQAVTADDVRGAAGRWLSGRPRVDLTIRGRDPAATRAAPLDRAAAVPSAAPVPFAAPGPNVARLRSGQPLWAFPKHDLPTVAGTVLVPGGALLQGPARPGLAQLTADMLDEGTKNRTAEDIARAAESLGASLSASCGWDGCYVGFRCLAGDVPALLELVADVLRAPAFPEKEWERVRGQSLAALQAERDSAEARAYRAFLKALYPSGHPYRYPLAGTEASLRDANTDDLRAYHARAFAPGAAAVVIAGDVETEALAAELDRRLTDWRGPIAAFPEVPEIEFARSPRLLLIDRPGAPQAVVRAGHRGIARLAPEHDAMLLFNQVLGGQFTARLNTKLREERGFTYGIRSQFDCRRGAGPFSIAASLQSDQIAVALNDLRDELNAFLDDRPPTLVELEDARRALVEGQPRQFEAPASLVGRYAGLLIHGLPASHEAELAARLDRIDQAAALQAARKLLRPEALIVVVVADAARARPALETISWADVEMIDDRDPE